MEEQLEQERRREQALLVEQMAMMQMQEIEEAKVPLKGSTSWPAFFASSFSSCIPGRELSR